MPEHLPPLKGLVMAGGRSVRMGTDKGALVYRDRPQRERVLEMLRPYCTEAFVSCRQEQLRDIEPGLPVLVDPLEDIGPLVGLLAAFRHDAAAAWLVVACDVPLLSDEAIGRLVESRSPEYGAVGYRSPEDGLIEPLVAIWEPAMASRLEEYLAEGRRSLRGAFDPGRVRLLEAPDSRALLNVNDPAEFERVKRLLG